MGLTFAVADIHGRYKLLEQALQYISTAANCGTVIFLGDYVDRGPDSRAVLERLMAGPSSICWRWICLQGNHEHMMARALIEHRPVDWMRNGGGQTLLSYGHPREGRLDYEIVPKAHIDWLVSLPLLHADQHRVFVHAGLSEALPLDEQPPRVVRYVTYRDADTSGYRGKHVVHGHRSAPFVTSGRRTALDVFAIDPTRLRLACFDDDEPGGPIVVHELRDHVAALPKHTVL